MAPSTGRHKTCPYDFGGIFTRGFASTPRCRGGFCARPNATNIIFIHAKNGGAAVGAGLVPARKGLESKLLKHC